MAMALTLLEVVDLERYFPVHQQLWSVLPVESALALSQTCRQLRAAHLRNFNINQRLTYFVRDPTRLRPQLGKHGALISGSFALQLLAQTRWLDSDLDIFVESGAAAEELDAYLQKRKNTILKRRKLLIPMQCSALKKYGLCCVDILPATDLGRLELTAVYHPSTRTKQRYS